MSNTSIETTIENIPYFAWQIWLDFLHFSMTDKRAMACPECWMILPDKHHFDGFNIQFNTTTWKESIIMNFTCENCKTGFKSFLSFTHPRHFSSVAEKVFSCKNVQELIS